MFDLIGVALICVRADREVQGSIGEHLTLPDNPRRTSGRSRCSTRLKRICLFHSVSNHVRGKRSSNSVSSMACYAFNLYLVLSKRLYDIHITGFDCFSRSITMNYHSCFHSCWPNSKTKLKLNHLWEQRDSLVFWRTYAACVFCV